MVAVLAAGGWLSGCARSPQPKMVYVQWQALLVYHPLWEAQTPLPSLPPTRPAGTGSVPSSLALPEMTVQPMQTPESERRRERLTQTSAQQQQALTARLQQMETRLLQEELNQLDAEQRAQMEVVRQQVIRQAAQEVEEALRQYQPRQADAEIKRRVVQRLLRIRPDQRDVLTPRLKEMEADQQALSEGLQRRLAQIEAETASRLRERMQAIQQEYERKRQELREQSAQRLQAERTRASAQIRAFADSAEPVRFDRVTVVPQRQMVRPITTPSPSQQSLRSLIEEDVKRWVEAICRQHRWIPVWQAREGVPDVTAQIARQMRGEMP